MSNKRKITWELPFKTMHYLNSLTDVLAKVPQIILLTAIQDAEGVVERVNITLRNTGENRDSLILQIGTIIGAHSVGYAARMQKAEENMQEFKAFCECMVEEILQQSKDQEQEIDFVPEKGLDLDGTEDLFKKADIQDDLPPEDKGTVTVDDKEEIESVIDSPEEILEKVEEVVDKIEEEEKVEEVIKEIVEIKEKASVKPKSKKKDNVFITKLRVILNNFKK